MLICYPYSFLCHILMLVILQWHWEKIETTDFVINLTFWSTRGFDFVLSFSVKSPLTTPVMNIDWNGGFGGSWYWYTKEHRISDFKWDSAQRLFQKQALRQSVKACYSEVSNRRWGWNKHGGWQISAKIINEEGAKNGEVVKNLQS